MALYSLCCLIPCLPDSDQELKCLEMKAVLAERMGEQEEGENEKFNQTSWLKNHLLQEQNTRVREPDYVDISCILLVLLLF